MAQHRIGNQSKIQLWWLVTSCVLDEIVEMKVLSCVFKDVYSGHTLLRPLSVLESNLTPDLLSPQGSMQFPQNGVDFKE